MKRLLERTGVRPEEIGYINAHATSTQIGDKAEMLAIRDVFESCKQSVHISSTKVALPAVSHYREPQDTCWVPQERLKRRFA